VQGIITRPFASSNSRDHTNSCQALESISRGLGGANKRTFRARDRRRTWHKGYWETEEFTIFKRNYHKVLEEHFDGLLDMWDGVVNGYKREPQESMVELFRW